MSGAISAVTGALSTVTSAASGGLLGSVLGLLRTASFRGVVFDVLDADHAAGRRWVRFLFPGRPDTKHEDLGAVDVDLKVNAILIGDDYVRRAQRLERACKAPGPATLRHPWLGPLKVVLSEPARFRFEDSRLRVCTVEMTFQLWHEGAGAPSADTLAGLLDRIDTFLDDAQSYVADLLAPLGAAIGLVSGVGDVLARVAGVWGGLFGRPGASVLGIVDTPAYAGGGTDVLADAAGPSIERLGATQPDAATLVDQVAALLLAVPSVISAAADVLPASTLGAGPGAIVNAVPDARVATGLLLAALPALQPRLSDPVPVVGVLLLARVQIMGEAVRAASLIPYESRDEAIVWRRTIDTALDAIATEALAAATARPLAAGPVWRGVRDLRAAWLADVNERAGRLSPVRHLVTTTTLSAWQIAMAVAGDNADAIRPAMLDLVTRNRIRHPGRVPAGRLEILL